MMAVLMIILTVSRSSKTGRRRGAPLLALCMLEPVIRLHRKFNIYDQREYDRLFREDLQSRVFRFRCALVCVYSYKSVFKFLSILEKLQ